MSCPSLSLSPSPSGGHCRSPSPCGGQCRIPSPYGGQRLSPSPCGGQHRTPSPCGGQRRSPNPCVGHRRSPYLRSGHRCSPSLRGDHGKKRSRNSYDGCNSSADLLVKRKRRKINDEMDLFEKQVLNTSAKGAIKGLLVVDASIDDYLADGHENVTVDVEEVMGMVDDDNDGGFTLMWTDLNFGFDIEDLLRTLDDDIGSGLQRPEIDCSVESDDQKSYSLEDIVEDGIYGEQRPHKLEFLVDDFQ